MKAKTIKLNIEHFGNADCGDTPTHVKLVVDDSLIALIKKAKNFIGDGTEFSSVNIENCQGESFTDKERTDGYGRYSAIRVTNYSIIYTDFHKHDGSATIETEDITPKIEKFLK